MKKTFAPRYCKRCADEYAPTGPAQRFCSKTCKSKQKWADYKEREEIEGRVFWPGPGGSYGRTGKDHWAYKHGIREFETKLRHRVKERRYCERCGEDLKDVGWSFWCAHHRDHDRTNNTLENLELLCKRCHQIEHECVNNLPNDKA